MTAARKGSGNTIDTVNETILLFQLEAVSSGWNTWRGKGVEAVRDRSARLLLPRLSRASNSLSRRLLCTRRLITAHISRTFRTPRTPPPDRSSQLAFLVAESMSQTTGVTAFHDSLGNFEAINEARQALDLHPPGDPDRSLSLSNLAGALWTRCQQLGDLDALAEAVELQRQAVDLLPQGHPYRPISLNNLAGALQTRFEQLGDLDALAEVVELQRQAVNLLPQGHPYRSIFLNYLAGALQTRFEQLGDLDALAEAVELQRQTVNLLPQGHPSSSLNNLASALTRFEQLGDLEALAEAVELHRQALALCPEGHPDRSMSLNALAVALQNRFEKLGGLESLAEAVELHRQALDLRPQGHPLRSMSLSNLAGALSTRFEQLGDLESLEEAVELHRQAMDLSPQGHTHRSHSLNNLACTLRIRAEELGDLDSLAEAVGLYRQVLNLLPQGHPRRSTTLNNLAGTLQTRFKQLGDIDSLTEAVELHRQALDLFPQGHPDRSTCLNNLANALHRRFGQFGDLDSLAETVELHRQALALCPEGHPDRSMSLNALADALRTRFEQFGDLESLAEAVQLHRQALDLYPERHTHRSASLNNLANALHTRFQRLGHLDSLAEAVELHRQALDLRPQGDPYRSTSLNNLAGALQRRFEQFGDLDSLAEAVALYRQALSLRPQGHPNRLTCLINLAGALQIQLPQLQDNIISHFESPEHHASDLAEALGLVKEGLRSCTDGHPLRTRLLFAGADLIMMLSTRSRASNLAEAICLILEALQHPTSPARESLRLSIKALRGVETVYQVMPQPLGKTDIGKHHYDDVVLEIYSKTIRLLPRAASFGLDHAGRLRELSGAEIISRNAATRAIAAGRDDEAVEMLEEGRGIFWSQALRLRATDLDRLPTQDAQKLRRLFQMLESEGVRDESLGTVQRERLVEQRRRLSNAAESLIADIRSRPGMSRFLLPPAFSSLVQSLPESGFVVVLVASDLGHRALVLNRAQGVAVSLEIVPPEGGFFTEAVRVSLPRDGGPDTEDKNVIRLMGTSGRAKRMPKEPLDQTLAQLWTLIVKPVVDKLNLQVSQHSVFKLFILM
jgi:tetratricopeptide (TPR) repeat protein